MARWQRSQDKPWMSQWISVMSWMGGGAREGRREAYDGPAAKLIDRCQKPSDRLTMRRGTSDKDKEGGSSCLDLEMQGGSECAWAERRGEEIVAYVAFVAVTRESFYAHDFEEGEGYFAHTVPTHLCNWRQFLLILKKA